MRYGRYAYSYLVLRFGLGIVFLWIGADELRHPDSWIGYVPAAIPFGLTRELALSLNAIFDIVIGALLLLGKLPKITALLAVGALASIIITQGINAVIIRDVGLFGAALALLLWPAKGHRKARWWKWGRRSTSSGYSEE